MIGHGGLKDTLETLQAPQAVVERNCLVIKRLSEVYSTLRNRDPHGQESARINAYSGSRAPSR